VDLGKTIREFRHDRGLTQREFAERVGVQLTTVQRWEAGTRTPRGKIKRDVLAILQVEDDPLKARLGQLTRDMPEAQLAELLAFALRLAEGGR
jgi:transcriptional regulator with XRE-family HTH domain